MQTYINADNIFYLISWWQLISSTIYSFQQCFVESDDPVYNCNSVDSESLNGHVPGYYIQSCDMLQKPPYFGNLYVVCSESQMYVLLYHMSAIRAHQ